MTYRLATLADVPHAVRAAARDRLEHAAEAIAALPHAEDPAKNVHEARKDLKKTRALLRLARPGLKPKVYARESTAARDLGRQLSGRRDADVLVKTIGTLQEHAAGRLPQKAFTDLADAFAEDRGGAADDELAAVAADLRAAAERTDTWRVRTDAEGLADGAAVAYARGHEAWRKAVAKPTTETLHDWRKRVKDLGYHSRLLHDAAPHQIDATQKDADELAELLGDEHDLGVLAERLADPAGPAAAVVVDADALHELIAHRREQLRAAAWTVAERLYAERPKAFRRRLRAYLAAAARDHAAPEPVA